MPTTEEQGIELSVVIPVFRSQPTLAELHQRLTASLQAITASYEIIFVDDCSGDGTWDALLAIRAADPHVRVIQLMRNFGQQRAVLCGLKHASGSYVVTMDDDLQQRPEEIELLYQEIIKSDSDIVIGAYAAKQHGLLRRLGTRAVKEVGLLTMGIPKHLDMTSFRIMRRRVVEEVGKLRSTNPVVGFLLFSVTQRVTNIEVSHEPRKHGRSTYRLRDLINYFLCMLIDYSDLPLRFVGWIGFLASLTSAALALFYLRQYFFHEISVSGFTTQVLLILFFFGLILMSLGIIGSYLIRILRAVNAGEMYIVRQIR